MISDINDLMKDKVVLILDHHQPEEVEAENNICHINPHLHGIDGSKEISGSGVVYLFSKAVDKSNEIEEDESSNEVTPIAARIRGRAKSTASSAPAQNASKSSQLNPYNKIKNAPIFNTRKKGKDSKI